MKFLSPELGKTNPWKYNSGKVIYGVHRKDKEEESLQENASGMAQKKEICLSSVSMCANFTKVIYCA